jgi:hypothetical protein
MPRLCIQETEDQEEGKRGQLAKERASKDPWKNAAGKNWLRDVNSNPVSDYKFHVPSTGTTSDAQGKKLLRSSIPVDHVYRVSDSNHPLLLQRKEEPGILLNANPHAAPKFRNDGFWGTKVQKKWLGAAVICFCSIYDSFCVDLLH